MDNNDSQERIILAIDGFNMTDAISFLKRCPNIKWIKVGLELFSKEGPDAIKILKDMNKKIFLDLKFHDIPNTMRSACYQVSKLGVEMISIHASAGYRALKISKEATIEGSTASNTIPPIVLGVTVLTSFSEREYMDELNMKTSIADNVRRLSELSFRSGLDGCVCSPFEVSNLRKLYGHNFQLITPGIRLNENSNDDKNRVMTPLDALSNGASKLVIGRSITKAQDPNKVFLDICKSLSRS